MTVINSGVTSEAQPQLELGWRREVWHHSRETSLLAGVQKNQLIIHPCPRQPVPAVQRGFTCFHRLSSDMFRRAWNTRGAMLTAFSHLAGSLWVCKLFTQRKIQENQSTHPKPPENVRWLAGCVWGGNNKSKQRKKVLDVWRVYFLFTASC